ncbi:MAG: hypothetical protein Q8P82_00840 [bacterium]|nr:hypothetical protein [bacterium]
MIPLSIILIPYGLFLMGFFFFTFVNVYHLIRFGVGGFVGFFTVFLFFGVSALLLFITYMYAMEIDWTRGFVIPSFGAPVFE